MGPQERADHTNANVAPSWVGCRYVAGREGATREDLEAGAGREVVGRCSG